MSTEQEAASVPGPVKRALSGTGKKADRLVELATVLAAGVQQHYGIDVPIHEVILPAAAMVWVLAHALVQYLNADT